MTAPLTMPIIAPNEAAPIYPVLLCGGSGTRLWPLSRQSYPKQFAWRGDDSLSLFQQAAKRFAAPADAPSLFAAPTIVTGHDFRFMVVEQLAAVQMSPRSILIEPEARNTAPAILTAALQLAQSADNPLLLVVPSDHLIPNVPAFRAAVQAAAPCARAGHIVTFGITPTRAETGYGWLELADVQHSDSNQPQPLTAFVEKPDSARAEAMLASGQYCWNAGIFLFAAQTLVETCATHCPDILAAVREALAGAHTDLGFTRLDAEAWASAPNISIDYAVMEKADKLMVMPFDAGWSDLGGWESVLQESQADADGNVLSEHSTAIECYDTLLRSESPKLELVGLGLTDIVAVAMPDAVLVAHRSHSQQVKDVVATLKTKGASQATRASVDYRPWGWFESLAAGARFQVKRIIVKPGGALSLQSHHHRAEHWIVVEGTARVTLDEQTRLLTENESVYIPLGAVHRLENPGKIPVVLIEVQTGSYLGEDDIIRYDDVYARS